MQDQCLKANLSPFPFYCRAEWMPLQPCSVLGTVWVWATVSCPQATLGFSTRVYLLRAEPGVHPRGSREARSVPPLSRVWPLFPIMLGAQGFAPPQPLFLPRQFCVHPSAGHAPTRPSLWTLTSTSEKESIIWKLAKQTRVVGGVRAPRRNICEYFHGPTSAGARLTRVGCL